MTFWSNTSDVIQPFLTRCDCWHRRLTTTSCYSTDQWCSGKYLFGGTDGERGARAYNAVLGAEPQRGPRAEPRWGSGGRSPPEAEKVLRFGHALETANLPYKLQLSVFWKLSKPLLFVISLQNWGSIAAVETRCKATLFTRSKTFRVEQQQYEGWTDTAGSKETEFTISLCVVPYRATRCTRYSGLLDNLLVYQNVRWKLLILVQYTTS